MIQKSFKDVVVIDPVEKFLKKNQTGKLFLDDKIHYTQKGNNIMAEEIYKKILFW